MIIPPCWYYTLIYACIFHACARQTLRLTHCPLVDQWIYYMFWCETSLPVSTYERVIHQQRLILKGGLYCISRDAVLLPFLLTLEET